MNQIDRIAAVSDDEAARMASASTLADLAERITATPYRETRPSAGSPYSRRPWLIGLPLAVGLAVALLAVTLLTRPGQKAGPVNVGPAPARAAALSFTRQGRYIDVIVRNPAADPKLYRAEFAAHHMHITLRLVPVSPSLVGTLVYGESAAGSNITTISAKGRCWTGGAGSMCPVGVRVPVGFRGSAGFTFGRAARPGEQYESTGPVTARGEAMHGLSYLGRPVPTVLAMLQARHVTVAHYRYQSGNTVMCGTLPRRIPASWRVYQAMPWAPQQVMLFVGPRVAPSGTHCSAGSPPGKTPAPSASPTAG